MESKKVVFIDNIGRTITGNLVAETETTIAVGNPAIVMVAPTQDGRMQVQIIPPIMREILADKNEDVVITYAKADIAMTSVTGFDEMIESQYNTVFEVIPTTVDPKGDTGNVVELFGDTNG